YTTRMCREGQQQCAETGGERRMRMLYTRLSPEPSPPDTLSGPLPQEKPCVVPEVHLYLGLCIERRQRGQNLRTPQKVSSCENSCTCGSITHCWARTVCRAGDQAGHHDSTVY